MSIRPTTRYHIFLFDLDGTLTDPKIGITKSVAYALKKFGIQESNLDKLTPFIGPPLKESFQKQYHFDEDKAWQAVQYFREYFSKKGMFENTLYDNIHELIKKLFESGKLLFVATSKPTVFSKQIIQFFNLTDYFEEIVGPELTDKKESKADVIKRIIDRYPLEDKASFVMIGDREQDIIGAKINGIDSIGVLFGYGSEKEIHKAKPTYVVKTVNDLERLFL